MRTLGLSLALILTPLVLSAQQQFLIKAGIQAEYMPAFRLNNDHFSNVSAMGIKLSVYNFKTVPVEIGFRYANGYHSSVAFSYGIALSYIFLKETKHLLKVGINGGKIKMAEYQYHIEVGQLIEDDYHEIIQPYIEWEWLFSNYISGYLQAGYRFLRSETMRVTEIVSKSQGRMVYRATRQLGLYGSGFQFSAGLKLLLFSN